MESCSIVNVIAEARQSTKAVEGWSYIVVNDWAGGILSSRGTRESRSVSKAQLGTITSDKMWLKHQMQVVSTSGVGWWTLEWGDCSSCKDHGTRPTTWGWRQFHSWRSAQVETTATGDAREGVTLLHVPKMKYPNRMTLREIHILSTIEEIAQARSKEQALIAVEHSEIHELLSRTRAEAEKLAKKLSPRSTKSHNYYARDKWAMKGDWHEWLQKHSSGWGVEPCFVGFTWLHMVGDYRKLPDTKGNNNPVYSILVYCAKMDSSISADWTASWSI